MTRRPPPATTLDAPSLPPAKSHADPADTASRKALLVASFTGYLLSGFLGQNLVFEGTTVSPLWPAAGLTLGLLWRRPGSARPIALGVFFGQLLVFWLGPSLKSALHGGAFTFSPATAPFALLPACGSALGALAAVALLLRLKARAEFDRPFDVLALGAVAAVQAITAACFGATTLGVMGAIPWSIWPDVATTWATGDWVGAVLVAPLVLHLHAPRAAARTPVVEAVLSLAVTAGIAWLVFLSEWLSSAGGLSGTYLCLLPLMWGALRFQGLLVATQTLLVAAAATVPTLRGLGPFAGFSELNARLFSLQIFMAVESLAAFLLSAIESQKRAAEAERDRKEAELIAARTRAEEGYRAKSEFLANMSHEIRTPLNGVLGSTQLLAKTELTPGQRDLVLAVRESGEGLMALLDGLLDLSKIEAGQLTLETAPFEPRPLAQSVTNLFRARLSPGVVLRTEADPALPARLLGDPVRLRQILSNLIGNAVKFTAEGSIVVWQGGDAQGRYVLEVRDTGIGIPLDRQSALFNPFVQVDASMARRYGGSGLGLAICRRLAEQMGGALSLTSKEGKGTTFRLELPLAVAPDEPRSERIPQVNPAAGIRRGARVLVVEDNAVNRMVAGRMLETAGATVAFAGNGLESLDRWEEGGWDLILMDCQMPEMDGLEATREIRRREAARSLARVPIVALTAGVSAIDWEHCQAAGMDDFLSKPVKLDALLGALSRWCSRGDAAAPRPPLRGPLGA